MVKGVPNTKGRQCVIGEKLYKHQLLESPEEILIFISLLYQIEIRYQLMWEDKKSHWDKVVLAVSWDHSIYSHPLVNLLKVADAQNCYWSC